MDDLVKLVAKKTGLPEDQARTAVKTVIDYLKERLPAPIGGQLDALLDSGQAASTVEGLVKGVEDLFKQNR
jgi:hypothetical protein